MAGDFNGDRLDGHQAFVLEPSPPVPSWVTVQKSDGGELYANPEGRTLYAHDFVPNPRQPGNGIQRPEDWVPVAAQPNDQAVGYWSIIVRQDGTRQWAFKGMPLYVNVRDTAPGLLNGVRSTDRVWRPLMTSINKRS